MAILGTAERIGALESLAYFAPVPSAAGRGLGVAAEQRDPLPRDPRGEVGRDAARFASGEVPLRRPGGACGVTPLEFEFWQGREHRLHDRFRYRRGKEAWVIERLAP